MFKTTLFHPQKLDPALVPSYKKKAQKEGKTLFLLDEAEISFSQAFATPINPRVSAGRNMLDFSRLLVITIQ